LGILTNAKWGKFVLASDSTRNKGFEIFCIFVKVQFLRFFTQSYTAMEAITLSFKRVEGFIDDEFYHFCLDNSDLSS
jgi:hypothetical protein